MRPRSPTATASALARAIAAGGKIPITYLKHKPQRVPYPGDELPKPWGWLLVGAALMGTFFYASRLLGREEQID